MQEKSGNNKSISLSNTPMKMKNDVMTNRTNLTSHRAYAHHPKPLTGSITNKYPVIFNDGKTIIFISDKSKEKETREKYASRGW